MSETKAYAAFNSIEPLKPFSFENKVVNSKDIKIEILYCGICHSDFHNVKNEWGGAKYPMVPGHEIVGKVAEIGSEVTKFKVGDLAGVGCLVDSCRECENCHDHEEQYCKSGFTGTYNGVDRKTGEITYGGYSENIVVDEAFVLKIPSNLALEGVAPLLCAGITTYSPLRHLKVGKNHKVGVVGLGGLGHMAVKLASSFGAEVTMLSTSKSKEVDAKRLGANHFELTSDLENVNKLKGTFDFIIDTVSASHDYNLYLSLLKTSGTLVILGAPPEPIQIQGFSLILGRKSIMGSLIGGPKETQEMLDYCSEHNITSDVEVIEIQKVNEAYDRLLKGDVRYRFVIDMASLKK
ncbi:MAG: NAD(P)-dependent alcohol dehydrogenase [Cyanobacteriota bacterium]